MCTCADLGLHPATSARNRDDTLSSLFRAAPAAGVAQFNISTLSHALFVTVSVGEGDASGHPSGPVGSTPITVAHSLASHCAVTCPWRPRSLVRIQPAALSRWRL